jgi:arylsulfatase A-like enzyme
MTTKRLRTLHEFPGCLHAILHLPVVPWSYRAFAAMPFERNQRLRLLFLVAVVGLSVLHASQTFAGEKPNVLLIVCDDLNDYIEGLDGHPQVRTPNIRRLIESGVSFKQAHCTIPICAPSRASLLTGLYPHTSRNFGFDRWDQNEVLKNSRTVMDHFRANGYHTLGTGKLMHHHNRKEWSEFGNLADYGPFAFDGTENVPHPDVPSPFRDDFDAIDGSFGPLVNLQKRIFKDGKNYSWRTGNWRGMRPLRIEPEEVRDPTADERNAEWAVEKLNAFAQETAKRPFFLGVGFLRPHTPLIVPERFFQQFPLDSLKLPVIKAGDVEDTHLRTLRGEDDRGSAIFRSLTASYDSRDEAIKRFLQAYLACVASVDELIGDIVDVVDNSPLKDNTIIVLTSDHGWGMGEKDYLYKNSLWEESTRVPLIVRAPGVTKAGGEANHPVSLIDLYPTLLDLCDLPKETRKNARGRSLDGHSLKPLLADPMAQQWTGPDAALTAVYKWAQFYDPGQQSYSLRTTDWRYIRYANGTEELYHNAEDPFEWTNLADSPDYTRELESFRAKLDARLPRPNPGLTKTADEIWKDKFFRKYPHADGNRDGTLSWPEYKAHKAKVDAKMVDDDADSKEVSDAEAWKDQFFQWHPTADTNQDGVLSWPEYQIHKAKVDARKAKKTQSTTYSPD